MHLKYNNLFWLPKILTHLNCKIINLFCFLCLTQITLVSLSINLVTNSKKNYFNPRKKFRVVVKF